MKFDTIKPSLFIDFQNLMNNLSQYHCDTVPAQNRTDQLRNENFATAEREPAEVPQVSPPGPGGEAATEEPAGNRYRRGHQKFCQTEVQP